MPRRKKHCPPRVVLLETSRLADLDSRLEALSALYDDLLACRDVMMQRTGEMLVLLRAMEATQLEVTSALDRHTAATVKRKRKPAEPSTDAATSRAETDQWKDYANLSSQERNQ